MPKHCFRKSKFLFYFFNRIPIKLNTEPISAVQTFENIILYDFIDKIFNNISA